ncbi:GvpL/GvpF family gas vesicle protein [Streptomyces turgidiscabies]|uniref:Gas vesicle protein, GvpL/GvpF family n=1 Tax=Streptomyces turgidiscabies (strain Car8) TaxID=698760 RepID=L7FAW2_STRT8|nr:MULTISPECIES: GvpL/GvpF family gas vesicle protein [Streptomyces]ELP68181.1 gas vesicle protein, GvpL/GvpF family [Streptomyces turgidiscabies Car8]MDX3491215.1 GvpL/GvpF family gas vesicle protein [Streptomyces turgidiscabies]GAQ73068.1 Gas vesicle synthesis protein GvpL/GvpF [Streptomyces turgidiscabies]
MTGLRYVYAVCRPFDAALQAQLTGVAGAPPGLLVHRGLVAVVSTVPEEDFAEEPLRHRLEDLDWLTATARAHQAVIDALTAVTTPLPLRLATVFRDDSGVRVMMEERENDFHRTLDRLDGRVEWGVKVYLEKADGTDAETDSASVPSDPPVTTGRDYLRRRRQHARTNEDRWRGAETFAAELHSTLSGCAEDHRLHAPQNSALSGASGQNVLNAAYLVPREDSEQFVELVDRTRSDADGTTDGTTSGLRVELTGPWAVYSFTGDADGSAAGEGDA